MQLDDHLIWTYVDPLDQGEKESRMRKGDT